MSDVSVRVRINDLLNNRRYAICVDLPERGAWVIDVDRARKLVDDLGEAIDAVERLVPFDVPGQPDTLVTEAGL